MMKETSMSNQCSICNIAYDQFQHWPMILCKQQHLCCEECATRLSNEHRGKCPQCRQDLNKGEVVRFRQYLDWLNETKDFRANIKKQQGKAANYWQITDAVREIMEFPFLDEENFYDFAKEKAQRLFEAGKNYASISLLQALIERFPNHQKYSFLGLGSKEQQTGFSEGKPLSWYKQRYGVKDLSAQDLLGHILMKTPEQEDSFQWYKVMIEKHPQNFNLLYGLALNHHNRRHYNDALQEYKRVIQLNPQFSKAYSMIAFLEEDQQQALKFANLCLARDPYNIFAKFLIASKAQEEVSNEVLNLVYQKQNLFVRALNEVGNNLYSQKQYQQAIKIYQTCLQSNSLYVEPKVNIAYSYISLGQQSLALQYLAKLSLEELDTKNKSEVLRLIGKAYKSQKYLSQATAYFKKSIETFPKSTKATINLAILYEEAQKYQYAVKLYLKVLDEQSSNITALEGITYCYLRLENVLTAINYYNKWIEVDPKNISIQYSLGVAYFKLKDWQNSLDYLFMCKAESYKLKFAYPKIIDSYYNLGDYKNAFKYSGQSLQLTQLSHEEYNLIVQKINKISKALNSKQQSK